MNNLFSKFQKIDEDNFDIFSSVIDILPQPIAIISVNGNEILCANAAGKDCFDNNAFWAEYEQQLSGVLTDQDTIVGPSYSDPEKGPIGEFSTLIARTVSYYSEKRSLISFIGGQNVDTALQKLERQEARLAKHHNALGKIAKLITLNSTDYECVLGQIIENLADTLHVDVVSVWDSENQKGGRFKKEGRKVRYFNSTNHEKLSSEQTPELMKLALNVGAIDFTQHGWQDGIPLTEQGLLKSSGLNNSLLVAIQKNGALTGYIQLSPKNGGKEFYVEDKIFAVSVASMTGRVFEARKVVEVRDALIQREKEYRAFIDHAPISSLVFDEDGVIRFVSSYLNRLMGYSAEEVIGQSIWRYIHPSDIAKFEEVLTALKQGEVFYDIFFKCMDAQGEWRQLEANGRDMREDDIVQGYIVGVRDISERHDISLKLEQTKMELRAIVDASQASISLVDQAGNIRRVNRVFGNKWNIPVKEAIARNALEIVPQDQFDLTMKGMDIVKRTGEKTRFTFEQKRRWFETHISQVQVTDGAPQAFVISMLDITDARRNEKNLRDSEARLRDIAEYATDWFWEADEKLNYSYLSETTDLLLDGAVSKGLGRNILELFCDDPEDDENVELFEILKARQSFRNLQRSFLDNGKTVYVVMAGKPLFTEDGIFLGYRGTGKNITSELMAMQQAKEVERKLFQSQKMEAVGQLTGGVAHDFNNLLAIICGNVELLKEQVTENPALTKLAGNALAAVERGASLTQRLLAFSRKQVLVPQRVYLLALVDGMKEILSRTLAEDIEIVTHYGENIWPVILDAAQMENSLLNLALNARDAMSGGGTLTIWLENKVVEAQGNLDSKDIEPGEYVSLTLCDTGSGIDPLALPYVFDPFYSTKAVGKGTGLGLSMVFGFVGQSDGYIFARSEVSKGTSFELLFPRNEAIVVNTEKKVEPIIPGELSACKILLVEDDEAVRAVTYQQLASDTCDVKIAGNAKEAIDILNITPDIDLLLTDIILPGVRNGHDLAEIAKKIIPEIKVLCMSGYLGDNSLSEFGGESELHFIGKPYRRSELLEKIQKIINSGSKTK